eukprot:1196040-Prorocentrum_minimum.AAC.1
MYCTHLDSQFTVGVEAHWASSLDQTTPCGSYTSTVISPLLPPVALSLDTPALVGRLTDWLVMKTSRIWSGKSGSHLEQIWITSGSHLEHIWSTSGSHLHHIWSTSESHLDHIWSTSESHLDHIWITSGAAKQSAGPLPAPHRMPPQRGGNS